MGYRHFDGALVYFNESEVGQAIREKIANGTVRREDIFYCGKVMHSGLMSEVLFYLVLQELCLAFTAYLLTVPILY